MGVYKNLLLEVDSIIETEKNTQNRINLLMLGIIPCIIFPILVAITVTYIEKLIEYDIRIGILILILMCFVIYKIRFNISRNIVSCIKYGFKSHHFIWPNTHKLELTVSMLVELCSNQKINCNSLLKTIEAWLKENNIRFQIIGGVIYFANKESLIHFKMVWL